MHNIPEFTVSQFSRSVKTLLEDSFGYIKITGEISGFKRAASGHIYFNLKDENALLSAVCFRAQAGAIAFEIGDGLQVCAFGRITTFEGRSNYQIIVESLEIAGIGAILEMLEKRRKKLLEEGLFDEIHKKPLPFFPKIIGVITSPTGAVIEDIKHRISNRCPTHLLIYPSLMQGDKAARDVILGIKYFTKLKTNRPDIIIIARGGGSFEDLLPFYDEDLVRQVFACDIPIISAIGHETDTTLLDYVADLRAPTPSAAAELAVPLIAELKNTLNYFHEKLQFLPRNFCKTAENELQKLQKYLVDPRQLIERISEKFFLFQKKLDILFNNIFAEKNYKLNALQITPNLILNKIENDQKDLERLAKTLEKTSDNLIKSRRENLENLSKLLRANNHQEILNRGFALLKNNKGQVLSTTLAIKNEEEILVEVSDGAVSLYSSSRQGSLL